MQEEILLAPGARVHPRDFRAHAVENLRILFGLRLLPVPEIAQQQKIDVLTFIQHAQRFQLPGQLRPALAAGNQRRNYDQRRRVLRHLVHFQPKQWPHRHEALKQPVQQHACQCPRRRNRRKHRKRAAHKRRRREHQNQKHQQIQRRIAAAARVGRDGAHAHALPAHRVGQTRTPLVGIQNAAHAVLRVGDFQRQRGHAALRVSAGAGKRAHLAPKDFPGRALHSRVNSGGVAAQRALQKAHALKRVLPVDLVQRAHGGHQVFHFQPPGALRVLRRLYAGLLVAPDQRQRAHQHAPLLRVARRADQRQRVREERLLLLIDRLGVFRGCPALGAPPRRLHGQRLFSGENKRARRRKPQYVRRFPDFLRRQKLALVQRGERRQNRFRVHARFAVCKQLPRPPAEAAVGKKALQIAARPLGVHAHQAVVGIQIWGGVRHIGAVGGQLPNPRLHPGQAKAVRPIPSLIQPRTASVLFHAYLRVFSPIRIPSLCTQTPRLMQGGGLFFRQSML